MSENELTKNGFIAAGITEVIEDAKSVMERVEIPIRTVKVCILL